MSTATRTCPSCRTLLPDEAKFCLSCGAPTPTEPGVPARTGATAVTEVSAVTRALAGRYRVLRIVGEGGMATVYLADDLKHQRQVAVKVMRPDLSATLGAERFEREVGIAARLTHPNILPMYDSGEAQGFLYYVMPFVDGENLRDRLKREGALPLDEALRLAREMAEALSYAHRRGIVHRDIKPANILLNEGHALVADFGIARAVEESGGTGDLTKTGLAIGTPQYMAPEQAAGERTVDGRADVYAVGAVLYEMLAGAAPFTGDTPRAILTKSLTESPKALSGVRSGITPAVDAVVQNAMARDPERRTASADLLIQALDALRNTGTAPAVLATPAVAATPLPRAATRTPLTWAIAAGAVIMLAAAGLWLRGRSGAASGSVAAESARLAVMPFENRGAAADAYFADGIADEVRGKLSSVRGLAVIASTSTGEYKGTSKRPDQIAKELGVTYLLTGTVRWAPGTNGGRRVQVVPTLLNAATGEVRWQETYDADVVDVFGVQAQIASRVASALGVALAPAEREQLASKSTTNLGAYQFYLRARAIPITEGTRNPERVTLLEQAVAADPLFADAWSDLSHANSNLYNTSATNERASRAKEALDRAIELAPNSPRTRMAASRYYLRVAKDVPRASQEAELALRAAPDDPDVLSDVGFVDGQAGRRDSAVARLERARLRDPRSVATLDRLASSYGALSRFRDQEQTLAARIALSPSLTAVSALINLQLSQGRLDAARDAIRSFAASGGSMPQLTAQMAGRQELTWALTDADRALVFRLTPGFFDDDRAWWAQSLATAHWQAGDKDRARAYADSALPASRKQALESPTNSEFRILLAVMLAYTGQADAARKEAREAVTLAAPPAPDATAAYPYALVNAARIELVLGQPAKAIDFLQQALRTKPPHPVWYIKYDPFWAPLRGTAAFDALMPK